MEGAAPWWVSQDFAIEFFLGEVLESPSPSVTVRHQKHSSLWQEHLRFELSLCGLPCSINNIRVLGMMDGSKGGWYAESWQCEGCGKDCSQDDGDRQPATQYKLCAACLIECEAGERCWVCAGRPCSCQAEGEEQ